MSKYKTILCGLLALMVFLVGCMSSKHAGQLSLIGKLYHNTTARYNGYYYAKIKMKETETAIIDGRKYDYSKLLPLFLAGNPEEEAVSGGDLDSVIKKLTVVATLHPLSKWADDCYFNIGKAYFYKQNYESALATFQYVSSEYKDAAGKKKKGSKGGKPQTSQQKLETDYESEVIDKKSPLDFLKHKPVHSEDLLWMVRSFINLQKYGEAQAILSYILNDPTFPEKWQDERAMVHTYLYLQMKNYETAIEPLKTAIDLTKNKKEKTRLTYLLAQIYELIGNTKLAAETYDQVTRLKPGYEMDFYARINLAKSYVASGAGSPQEIIQKLEQMAHDEKYEEFYDQIYFTIAEIYLQQGNTDEAIKNFETSIEKSISNNNQKGLSFLKIGEFYFEDQDYLTAQPNYDSAVAFLDTKFETLDDVISRQKILDNLAKQVHIILLQDSLQKLAKMDEKERNKILDDLVSQSQKQNEISSGDSLLSSEREEEEEVSSGSSGGWYFYNTNLKSAGFNEFQKLWGGRKNEDNWRRSNKNSGISDENADNTDEELIDEDGTVPGEITRESLLAGLPLTDEKMQASNNKIFSAYYALGMIYKNDLQNSVKAIETFEKLTNRFPDHADLASVYYNLYLLHSQLNNFVKAEQYKQILLQNYSSSDYAGILSDPNYFANLESQSKQVDVYYASTYDFYVNGNYAEVMTRIQSAQATFKNNPLQPKFDLLEAFAIGKTQTKEAYIAALDSVVVKHPQGQEHDKAVEILSLLGVKVKGEPKLDPQGKNEIGQNTTSVFTLHPDNPHFVIVFFPKISPISKAVSDSLANYNTENYSLANLKVSSQLLDAKRQMVVVKSFKNMDEAMDYFDDINTWGGYIDAIGEEEFEAFIIDDKNFQTLYQKKNVDDYLEFFSENY